MTHERQTEDIKKCVYLGVGGKINKATWLYIEVIGENYDIKLK